MMQSPTDRRHRKYVPATTTKAFPPEQKYPKIRGAVQHNQEIAQINKQCCDTAVHKSLIADHLKSDCRIAQRKSYVFSHVSYGWENIGDEKFHDHQDEHHICLVFFSKIRIFG